MDAGKTTPNTTPNTTQNSGKAIKLVGEEVLLSWSPGMHVPNYFNKKEQIEEISDEIGQTPLFVGNGSIVVLNPLGRNLADHMDQKVQECTIPTRNGVITIGDFFDALGSKYDELEKRFGEPEFRGRDEKDDWYVPSCQFYEGICKTAPNTYKLWFGS